MAHHIKTWLNYEPEEPRFINEDSQTQPDLSLSIKDLIKRSQSGLMPPAIGMNTHYTSDDLDVDDAFENDIDLPTSVLHHDLTDIQEYGEQYNQTRERIETEAQRTKELQEATKQREEADSNSASEVSEVS